MEGSDIEQLCNGSNLMEITRILQNFLQNNEKNAFTCQSLFENNQRVILWTALFQLLQRKECQSVHAMCLNTIRILSRDKTDLEGLLCEQWIKVLIEKAGLYNLNDEERSMSTIGLLEKDINVEALKCLCNLTFNSEVSRLFCAETDIAQSLVTRLRIYNDIPFKNDLMLFDMKLLFILTALRLDIRAKIKELHGMEYLTSLLNEIILESSTQSENASCSFAMEYLVQDEKHAIACDILKAQFNLIMQQDGPEEAVGEYEEAMFLKLMPTLTSFLNSHSSSDEKTFELHNNIANLLTSVPSTFYSLLTPMLNEGESARYTYDGRNMNALQSLVNLLQHKLTITHNAAIQYENLSPILTVMNKCARIRSQRKYLRQVVLPPLRDVSLPPEKGNTLRNQLCRLLTTPVTTVRDLVAEFLFILCKEKVGRMVKYTGFGNAAGHLAQKGLLSGIRSAQYSSSSDDSDTEEYLEAQPNIDPVVGCTRPPRANPFEGMTEEQKEYEAMKLVNLFDAMVTQGIVKPARIGPDGRPQPVDHVLELRDDLPKRPQS